MFRRNRNSVIAVAIVALVLLAVAIVEGDLPEALTHVGSLVIGLLNRFGAAACLALLYIEESGIPLPVPGDFYVAFLGRLNAGSLQRLMLAWDRATCTGSRAVGAQPRCAIQSVAAYCISTNIGWSRPTPGLTGGGRWPSSSAATCPGFASRSP